MTQDVRCTCNLSNQSSFSERQEGEGDMTQWMENKVEKHTRYTQFLQRSVFFQSSSNSNDSFIGKLWIHCSQNNIKNKKCQCRYYLIKSFLRSFYQNRMCSAPTPQMFNSTRDPFFSNILPILLPPPSPIPQPIIHLSHMNDANVRCISSIALNKMSC